MNGFLFRQKGTDSRAPRTSIPGLTVRHLQYISTRPGAVYNPECGFSLWGSISPFQPPENITSLDMAKQLVRAEAERGRSMFRAILSLGEPDASEQGFYDRGKWEPLVNDQIASIAKGMNIPPGDFRWLASMHIADGHPHVHIIFWDGGKEPRKEYMPPQKFKEYSESIRKGCNRFVWGEEIRENQNAQKETSKELRMELRAMFSECNPTDGLDVKGIYRDAEQLSQLSEHFMEVFHAIPQKGSLKYAYLPPEAKAKVNALLDEILELPQFSRRYAQYLDSNRKVSQLYGNDEKTQEQNRKQAIDKLHRDLGNELLSCYLKLGKELSQENRQRVNFISEYAVRQIPSRDFQSLLDMLPQERIPWKEMENIPGFAEKRDAVLNRLFDTPEIEILLQNHVSQLEQERGMEPTGGKMTPESSELYRESCWFFYQESRDILTMQLREAKGYYAEWQTTSTVQSVSNLFSLLCRLAGQSQARTGLVGLYLHSRDKSIEARRDIREKFRQSSQWGQEQ